MNLGNFVLPRRSRTSHLLCELIAMAALFIGTQAAYAQDTTTTATTDHACAEDQYKSLGGSGSLNCTANDLVIAANSALSNNTIQSCPNDGLEHLVDINLSITSGSPSRYDVGYFVGQAGNSPIAAGGQCSVDIFPTSGGTGWFNGDNNPCGDYSGGSKSTVNLVQGVKVTCIADGNGNLLIPYAVLYANNTNGTCTSVDDVTAGTSSKCQAATVPVTNVFVTTDANPSCTKALNFDGTQTITSTITISNNDPLHTQDANGTQFEDNFNTNPNPPTLTVTNATCGNPQGGAVCGSVTNTSGDVKGTITTFPFNGSVDITITATTPTPNPPVGTYVNNVNLITPPTVLPPSPPYTFDPQTGISTFTNACTNSVDLPVKLQSFDVK